MNAFIFPLRVHIEDTDFTGIVYHSNYLKFFERARSEWADQMGLGIEWQQAEGIFLPVRSIQIEFLKPATLHQKVEVVSRITEIRKASIIFDQYLRLSAVPDTILCRANIKLACVGLDFKPRALPELFFIMENERDN